MKVIIKKYDEKTREIVLTTTIILRKGTSKEEAKKFAVQQMQIDGKAACWELK